MDGIVRILKSNKSFYDGTATECPAVTLNDLLTEDDPVIPFFESFASQEVDPRDLANLRKQVDDVSKMVARACDRLYERFRLGTANKFKSDFRTFFSDCLVPGAPEGWSRSAWICSRCLNAMFTWIHLCYGVELREEDCLRTVIAVPGFRIETAGERISRMKAHDAWDWQFRSTVPNIKNCVTFFLEVTLYLNYLVDDSPKYFVYDIKEKKGSCEEEVSYALKASMDHAPFDKYMAAEASHWIRLARIRMITALANSFAYRWEDDRDDQQAGDLWKELNSMIVLQDAKLKLDFEPDEVSLIIRLADLAAERAQDYWKDKRQYDNVLPLAKMSATDEPGVDFCDLRPLDNHPFKWRGPIVAWYGRLKSAYEAKADSKSILDIIDNTTFAALEYYRVLTICAPYLRGEADSKPEPFTGKDGEVQEFERILTSSVERVLLKPMSAIIEQLPSLNTAVAGYPIERLEDLFKALNLFATAMNHCEEEKTSAEGVGLGQAVAETLLLGRLVCPKKNAQGRYVLERSLIAEKFRDFHKSIRLAACCIRRKAEKRAGGKIELGDLEAGEKKGLGIGDQGSGDRPKTAEAAIQFLRERDRREEDEHIERITTTLEKNWVIVTGDNEEVKGKPKGFRCLNAIEKLLKDDIDDLARGVVNAPCSCGEWQRALPDALAYPYDAADYYEASDDEDEPDIYNITLSDGSVVRLGRNLQPHPLSATIDSVRDLTLRFLADAFRFAQGIDSKSCDMWVEALGNYNRVKQAFRMPQSRPLLEGMVQLMIDAMTKLDTEIKYTDKGKAVNSKDQPPAPTEQALEKLLPPLQQIAESSERSASANEKTLCKIGELKGKLIAAVTKTESGIRDCGLEIKDEVPTKIAAPDLADAADCRRFISELAETIEREYQTKIHNHRQAVNYILTGAKSGDLFYEDCKIARQIKVDRNWEYATFFNYSKPKHLPKPKNLRKAARKRATQKKTRKELKRLAGY